MEWMSTEESAGKGLDVWYLSHNSMDWFGSRFLSDSPLLMPFFLQSQNHIGILVEEVVPQHSCLVFCPTKLWCENESLNICKTLPKKLKQVSIIDVGWFWLPPLLFTTSLAFAALPPFTIQISISPKYCWFNHNLRACNWCQCYSLLPSSYTTTSLPTSLIDSIMHWSL